MLPTGVVVSDGTRRFTIMVQGEGRCNAAQSTGHVYTVQRRLNGGAWTTCSDAYAKIYVSNVSWETYFFTTYDDPPVGNIEYCVRLQGHGINGNQAANQRISVWDAGSRV